MNLRAVKGMNDILPDEMGRWSHIEEIFRKTLELSAFREVRTPIVESTNLFVRSMGEVTDVVEKEMYSFARHDDELTLRPEGTAGAARAYLEHKLHGKEAMTRWYYIGQMFRGERPARGRYRQFWQAGAELYGDPGPVSDAEMIDMLAGMFRDFGVKQADVLINSLGGPESRERYRVALLAYLTPHKESLSAESQRRLERNPFRVLDSKAEVDRKICETAPSILESLSPEDSEHFDGLRRHLDALGTPYTVEPRLVRGLDYYTRTLFEIKGEGGELGAQNTLCGGGRYDNLIADLGGPKTPCIGFAMGLERLLLAAEPPKPTPRNIVYVAPLGEAAVPHGLRLARDLRARGAETILDGRGQKIKTMLHRADAVGARFALLIGDSEVERGIVRLKDLRSQAQEDLPLDTVVSILVDRLAAPVLDGPAPNDGDGASGAAT
jgi:histidyl-tRNA synthetase